MSKFLNDCFTNANGDYDIGRVLWAVSVVVFLGLSCWNVFELHQTFSYESFGTGLGLVLAAGGAALGLKHKTEPSPQ